MFIMVKFAPEVCSYTQPAHLFEHIIAIFIVHDDTNRQMHNTYLYTCQLMTSVSASDTAGTSLCTFLNSITEEEYWQD